MSTTIMDYSWKGIAGMKHRSGRVEDFLVNRRASEIDSIIETIKEVIG
jgi:hypothetical protein